MKGACDHEALVDRELQQHSAQPEMGSSALTQSSKERTKMDCMRQELAHVGMRRPSKTQRRIIGGVARELSSKTLRACHPADSSLSYGSKEPVVFRLDSDEPQPDKAARGSSLTRGYETLGVQHVFHMCDGAGMPAAALLGSRNPDTRNSSVVRIRSTSALALDLGQEAAVGVPLPRSSSMASMRAPAPGLACDVLPERRRKKLPELPSVGHAGSVAWSRRPFRTMLQKTGPGTSTVKGRTV